MHPPRLRSSRALAAVVVLAGCGDGSPVTDPAAGAPVAAADAPRRAVADAPPSDDVLAERLVAAKRVVDSPGEMNEPQLAAIRADLQQISNRAQDRHLRANAALLLGSIHEGRGARSTAIGHYRHATKLVPDDAGPHMVLALALAADSKFNEAAQSQLVAAKLDPDNLENWLALGEMRIKADDRDGATEAYAAYELRRKGLLDGLTLRKDGAFSSGPEDRAGCARALAAATDNGTALALLYALENEPEASVRKAIVETMGVQRLRGYAAPMGKRAAVEPDAGVKEVLAWAMAEVARDPVDARPAAKPE